MSVGLAAQLVAALQHTFKDVSCACSRAHQLYAVVGGVSAESEGTACGDHCGILEKGTLFLHISGEDRKLPVSVNKLALFIDGYAPVCVTVKSKSAVTAVTDNYFHEAVYVCAAALSVYVCAVGLVRDDYGLRSQRREQLFRGGSRAAVGTVQSHLHAAEVSARQLLDMLYVLLRGFLAVDYPSHLVVGLQLYLLGSSQHQPFYLLLSLLHELAALCGEQLQTVVLGAVVASRYHYASVGTVGADKVCDRRCGNSSQQLCVCSYRAYTCADRCLQRV